MCCVVLPLSLGARKWPVFLFMSLYSVFMTWVKLYSLQIAVKQMAMMNYMKCKAERQGLLVSVRDFTLGLLYGLHDPCEDYYTAAVVDPALEVGFDTAIMETCSLFLQSLGLGVGKYYFNIITPLPFIWKIPVIIVSTILLITMMILCHLAVSTPNRLLQQIKNRT